MFAASAALSQLSHALKYQEKPLGPGYSSGVKKVMKKDNKRRKKAIRFDRKPSQVVEVVQSEHFTCRVSNEE